MKYINKNNSMINIDRHKTNNYNARLRSVAQPGSAPGLGPGGPRFESLYSDQKLKAALFRQCGFFTSQTFLKRIQGSPLLPNTLKPSRSFTLCQFRDKSKALCGR